MCLKLFVSHSTKTDANLAQLKEVCALLGERGYLVLVDQGGNIPVGDDWNRRLNEWLAECHAAVVLFSQAAFDSDWVKRELAILSWRHQREATSQPDKGTNIRRSPGFKLLPILLDGVNPDDLTLGFFNILRMGDIQSIHQGASCEEIVEQIAARLPITNVDRRRTPFESLERKIAKIINEADGGSLEDAVSYLEMDTDLERIAVDDGPIPMLFARQMLRNPDQSFFTLKTILNAIHPRLSLEQCKDILSYLRPVWVDLRSAAYLSAARENRQKNVLALNGRYPVEFTARCYRERAWLLDSRPRSIQILPGQHRYQDILDQICAEFDRIGSHSREEALKMARDCRDPIVMLFPAPTEQEDWPDTELLNHLTEEFPTMVIIVPTGERYPEYLPELIVPIQPALNPEYEERQYISYRDTDDFINNRLHDIWP